MKRIIIQNQAMMITVKPQTKLIEIGTKIYEIGYHYKKFHGKKNHLQKMVLWY